ncbi:MAG: hypothetical protein LC744_05035 [Chloroflexi bacterium]|nr:hypothetical protein [Chloroflexota bacterium]
MPTRTPEERAASRAEARRRARLSARGELTPEEPTGDDSDPTPSRGGFFGRLFPPAPPLPNRPDPLAKFNRHAPLRPLRERMYLLRRNPLPWVLPSLTCFIGYFLSQTNRGNTLALIATFLTFGSVIAAGWFGWQRPSLFGTVAALIAFVLFWVVVILTVADRGAGPTDFGEPLELAASFLLQGLIQGGLGFLGGWYGGYLRRRQTQVAAETRTASARRRR